MAEKVQSYLQIKQTDDFKQEGAPLQSVTDSEEVELQDAGYDIIEKRKGINQRLMEVIAVVVTILLFWFTPSPFGNKPLEQSVDISIINSTTSSKDLTIAELKRKIQQLQDSVNDVEPLETFNTDNPNSDFCPYATCNNTPLCQPCLRRFIFEISIGRSGSTTVLDMLNMLPDVRLAGENENLLKLVEHMIWSLENDKLVDLYGKHFASNNFHDHWHYKSPYNSLACPAQKFIEAIDPPMLFEEHLKPKEDWKRKPDAAEIYKEDAKTIIGFKSVRFRGNINLMVRIFPCSRFIFTIRTDLEAQAKSAWWKDDSKTEFFREEGQSTLEYLKDANQKLLDMAQFLGSQRAFVLKLEEWKSDITVFDKLAEWLGFVDCKYKMIPHANANGGYGWANKQIFFNKSPQEWMGENCRYAGKGG